MTEPDYPELIRHASEAAQSGYAKGEFAPEKISDELKQVFVKYEVLPLSALFDIVDMFLYGFELHFSREERDRLDSLRDILAAIRRKTDTTEKE